MSNFLKSYVDGGTKKPPTPGSRRSTPKAAARPAPKKYVNPNLNSLKAHLKARGFPEEDILIPKYDKSIYNFLNKSSVFYGPSDTGKTVLINDFMYRMKHLFPRVVVFAPTNHEKHDYDGIVPTGLIFEEFTLENIKELYEQQRAAASVYNNANDLKVLHGLFKKVATRKSTHHLEELLKMKKRALIDVEKNSKDVAELKKKRGEVKDLIKSRLIDFYKSVIKPHKEKFVNNKNLNAREKLAIKFLDYNPHILVIFDDAQEEIKAFIREGKKNNDNVIKNFFFKGRHAKITHFYAFQDDSGIDPDIRKNAFNSFFTHPSTAIHFFNTASNGFSPYDKKKAATCLEEIFSEENDERFCKLVYTRGGKNMFQYTIADVHDDFKMCSKLVRKYASMVARDESEIDVSNPHMSSFMDGI
jgi:hypothetical protein